MPAVTVYTNREEIERLQRQVSELCARISVVISKLNNHILDHMEEEEE